MKTIKKPETKKADKITRGYNLKRENVMALRNEAFERTMATTDGSTVSASEVLDEIVTKWRQENALAAAGGEVVPVVIVKGSKK